MSTSTDADRADAVRLVRRMGFGATGAQVDAALAAGPQRFVAGLLTADREADAGAHRTPVPTFAALERGTSSDPSARKKAQRDNREQGRTLTAWWLRRMVAVDDPFGEKMTFAWHSHFATSLKKVKSAPVMLAQNQLFRRQGTGDFGVLARSVLLDAATQRWLDGAKNTVKGPNENLSREFMEVFTLGHADGYTETDVREAARALTGYRVDVRTGTVELHPALHDQRPKTFLGRTGDLGADDVCDAVLARPGCAPYVVGRLWSRFVSTGPLPADALARLVTAYGPARSLTGLFTALFTDPSFAAAAGTFVIGPVEWLVGALRALHVPLDSDALATRLLGLLDSLGQLPLFPPSVGGWPSGVVWLSTAAADLRFDGAALLAEHAELSALRGSTTARLEALAHLLGVPAWSAPTLGVLKGAATDTRHLVAVALNTPEYLVH